MVCRVGAARASQSGREVRIASPDWISAFRAALRILGTTADELPQADVADGMTALQLPRAVLAVVVVFLANAATGWLHRHD
jgi:hypothetical protein